VASATFMYSHIFLKKHAKYTNVSSRVARLFCKKCRPKCSPPIFVSKLICTSYICNMYTLEKSSPKFCATSVILKPSPKRQKFALSGHPGRKQLLFKMLYRLV
jgi:hypothetical protein